MSEEEMSREVLPDSGNAIFVAQLIDSDVDDQQNRSVTNFRVLGNAV